MVKALLLGLAAMLAACQPAQRDEIVFAVATPPSVLDPGFASDAASERVNALLYERLVELDRNGEPVPAMADWEMLDERHYRVRLRPDRRPFADGSLPGARDAAASYRRVIDAAAGSPHASALAHVASIEVRGEDELLFTLSRPDPLFPQRLTLGIVPADRSERGELVREPLGSGPFGFVAWRENGGLELRRHSDGQVMVFEPVPDPTMRALKLLRGEADLLQNDLPSELYDYLGQQPGIDLATVPGITFAYVGFNLADPVMAKHEVRTAIAHAIDRRAIVTHLFGGRAELAESVLRPGHWAGGTGLQPHGYDPEAARRSLALAGYGPQRPLEISYKTSTDPFRLRIAHVLQGQLAEVGIRLRIQSYDWGTFFGDIKAGRFQMYSLAWVGVNTPDILRYAFHSASLAPAGANRGRYLSGTVDRLIDAAEQARGSEAARLFRLAQRQIHEDLVYVPLWYEANVVASRGLTGYTPGFDGNYLALNRVRRDG